MILSYYGTRINSENGEDPGLLFVKDENYEDDSVLLQVNRIKRESGEDPALSLVKDEENGEDLGLLLAKDERGKRR